MTRRFERLRSPSAAGALHGRAAGGRLVRRRGAAALPARQLPYLHHPQRARRLLRCNSSPQLLRSIFSQGALGRLLRRVPCLEVLVHSSRDARGLWCCALLQIIVLREDAHSVKRRIVMGSLPYETHAVAPELTWRALLMGMSSSSPRACCALTGFPPFDHAGFKIGKFGHLGETADPDHLDRDVNAADEACLREAVTEYFPLAGAASTCETPCRLWCPTFLNVCVKRCMPGEVAPYLAPWQQQWC